MNEKCIAVAGGNGFIGSHTVEVCRKHCQTCVISREMWQDRSALEDLLRRCDAVIMLAGMSRCSDGELLYRTNMELMQTLVELLPERGPRVVFGSTTHEKRQSPYHASKRDSAALLEKVAAEKNIESVTVLMPNTFGPGGKPFYNSVVSTFCYQAARGEKMSVSPDAGETFLIDVRTLAVRLYELAVGPYPGKKVVIPHRFAVPVSRIADELIRFAAGQAGEPEEEFLRLLYETCESYKMVQK